jgi:DNA-binding transcriptional LysR family regulator
MISQRLNIHHLQLFYYVSRHGGISAAVRHIPYGIQQPAVSGQMRQLEESVGEKLFERSPFRLTPAGLKLFAYVRPFFDNLGTLATEMRGDAESELRLGGAELALRVHVPNVMQKMKQHFPKLRFSLRSGFQTQLEDWLRDDVIDLAVTAVEARPPARLRQLRLTEVPLVLLVHRSSGITSAEELFARKRLAEPLISVPGSGLVSRNFQRGLKKRAVKWPQTIEATSIELVADYVANGDGCGVSIAIAPMTQRKQVRVLPLTGFDPMTIGILWRREPSPLVRTVIDEICDYSRRTFPDWAVPERAP